MTHPRGYSPLVFQGCGHAGQPAQQAASLYAQRLRRSWTFWCLFQTACFDGRILEAPLPVTRRPRPLRPALVRPLSSRCLCTLLQIQLILGSSRTALCIGSTMITSYQLCTASLQTQYEFKTRSSPSFLPTRSSAIHLRFRVAFCFFTPALLGLP